MKKDIVKKIVTYDSILDKQMIALSTREQDVFFLALFYMQHKNDLVVPYSVFKNMLNTEIPNRAVFSRILKSIMDKLENSPAIDIEHVNKLNIFKDLSLNDKGDVHISLNSDYYFLFENSYEKSTKKLYLDVMMKMSSKYDKTLYRILSSYKNSSSGWHRVTEDELHQLMCFPDLTQKAKNNYRIKKSVESISQFLKVEYEIKINIFGSKYFHFKIS